MKTLGSLVLMFLALPLPAQSAQSAAPEPWQPVAFLEGAWTSSTAAAGYSGGKATGTYSFTPELGNHILARHTVSVEACKGPATFDCGHGDLLYIYQEMPGQPLKAIYFDNEGHVIQYDVSAPNPTTAVFLSDRSQPGPQYQLVYQLNGEVMSGKFQIRVPGQSEWKSYLEWSGERQIQQSGDAHALTPDRANDMHQAVKEFARTVAHDVTAEGPSAWRRYFETDPAFFMAVNGRLAFPNSAAADEGIEKAALTIKQIELEWGNDLRVDPLTQQLALVAAPWREIQVDAAGHRTETTGFFTGLAEFRDGHWRFRDVHWSEPVDASRPR